MISSRSKEAKQGGDESIVRSSFYSLAGIVATTVCTAVLTLFLVRALAPSGYGVFALALSIGGMVALPADLGLSSSAARYIAEHRSDRVQLGALLADATRVKAIASTVACVGLAMLAGPIADAYHAPNLLWPLRAVSAAVFGQTMMFLYQGAYIADRKLATNAKLTLVESVTELGASVVLVIVAGGATGATAGRAVGYLTGAAVAAAVAARTFKWPAALRAKGRTRWTRRIASYGVYLVLVDSAFVLFNAIDLLLIAAFLDTHAVGLFSSPVRLLTLLGYPGIAVADGIANRMVRTSPDGPNAPAFVTGLRTLIVLQSVMLAPLLVWARPVVDILLGSAYHGSVTTLRVFAATAFLQGIAPLLSLSANFLGEGRSRVPLMLTAAVLDGLIDVILIPRIGIVSGAIATGVAFIVMDVGHLIICRRHITFAWRDPLVTMARAFSAATVMAAVLFAFGTNPSIPMIFLGGILGLGAFVACLVAGRELTPAQILAAYHRILNVRSIRA